MTVLALKLALAAASAAFSSATTLRVLGAGQGTAPGILLTPGFSICAADYPNGVSVVCEDPNATKATFYVNGKWQRNEGIAPFTINGNYAGNVFKWTPPSGPVTIKCEPTNAASISLSGTFDCAPIVNLPTLPTPVERMVTDPLTPPPTTALAPKPPSTVGLVLRAVRAGAGGNTKTISNLANGFSFCPTAFPEGVALVCDAAGASGATFEINGAFNNKEETAPFTIAGDSNGFINKWNGYPTGAVTIKCYTPEGADVTVSGTICGDATAPPAAAPVVPLPEPPVTPLAPTPVGVDASYCVGIKATDYFGPLSKEWTVDGQSLWFRQNDDRTGSVGAFYSQMKYKFTVPIASTYGFTLDMDVGGVVDYNDVFVGLSPGGWTVRGNNKETGEPQELSRPGLTKAYHNKENGRQKFAFTVDFNPHTFASAQVLQPNVEYTLTIAGRSSKVQVYGAILFPCSGDQCKVGVGHWQQYISICNV